MSSAENTWKLALISTSHCAVVKGTSRTYRLTDCAAHTSAEAANQA